MAEHGNRTLARWRRWALANLGSFSALFTNTTSLGSAWLILAPVVSLVATYAPRRLFLTYFNLFLRRRARRLLNAVDPYVTIDISEPGGDGVRYSRYGPVSDNDSTYEEVKAYLSAAACSQDARELRAEGAREGDGLVVSLRDGQDVADEFRGVSLWWSSVVVRDVQGQRKADRRFQRLTFHLSHRGLVVDEYLPHVRRQGREILFSNRRRRLYTNSKSRDPYYEYKAWSYIDFDHPTTFDTLAMDGARKRDIMDDLDTFRNSREFYRRAGKPWKRGYLLYGPPGTGKSTMVAAMANYLDYDIYDVELTVVHTNSDLRKLLIETTSKSIIVIEDIDCTLDVTGDRSASSSSSRPRRREAGDEKPPPRRDGVTLSGLLNFIDGLWSACGAERIVVFTTNHVEKLDPALIRRGRMDMHVEMSYCRFEAFQTLAKNYLGVDDHELFGAVGEVLREEDLTPADVAECLMTARRAGSGEPSRCLEVLIDELKKRAVEKAKAEAEAKARAEAEAKAWAEAEARAAVEGNAAAARDPGNPRRAGSGEPSACLEILIDELKKRAVEKAKARAEAEAEAEAKALAEAEARAAVEANAAAAGDRGNLR